MHLLVTRPHPDADDLITQLEHAGHKVSNFPLLKIKFLEPVPLPMTPPQAVLITSANGARALANHPQMASLANALAITVGPASAAAASQAGFKPITQTERGDVIGLIDYVRKNLRPQDGPLLYASGTKTSGDLVRELQKSNFQVDRAILYDAVPAAKLPEEICQKIEQKTIDGVLLFSPRTAKRWLSLTKACISSAKLAKLQHYCLSKNVANIIDQGVGSSCDIIICKKPDTTGMLNAIISNAGMSNNPNNRST